MAGESPKEEPSTIGSPQQAPSGAHLSGRFGRYDVERLLGRGGMGAVYLARQLDLDRPVVIKVIAPELARDDAVVARLQREARSAARISSDNVVHVHETGTESGIPFIAMEYVDGRSASALLAEVGRVSWPEATRIVAAAARGLQAAHEVSVLHRDVKPANILIAKDGRVKVADFGLAKIEPVQGVTVRPDQATMPSLSIAGQILGTPAYMAPEQADGKAVDARADIYALGVTYYELLTGKLPFRGETALKTLALVISAPVKPPREIVPDLPEAVERACLRLMAREPERRPESAAEVVALLERLAASTPSGRLPALAPEKRTLAAEARDRLPSTRVVLGRPVPERSSLLPGIVAAAVIVLVPAGLFVALRHGPKPLPPPPPPVVAPPAPEPSLIVPLERDPPPPPQAAEPMSGPAPAPAPGPPPAVPAPLPAPKLTPPAAPASPPSAEMENAARELFDKIQQMPRGPGKPDAWRKLVDDYPGTAAANRALKGLATMAPDQWRAKNAEWLAQHGYPQ
jgi:serine/threonine-protein kinase